MRVKGNGTSAQLQPDRYQPHAQYTAGLRCLMSLPRAPLHNWDALDRTSRAAHSALEVIWNHSDALLQMRGCRPPIKPQLPVIPLGINAESFRPVCSRHEARRRLQLPANANVVLWTGRFELHCKAHHGATFRALAHAAGACPERPWVLLMYGTAVMPTIPPALLEAAAEICPTVEVRLLDGHDLNLVPRRAQRYLPQFGRLFTGNLRSHTY